MKLICYLALGSPNLKASIKIATDYVKAGCDVIEVDFPTEDPYLDSPYIQQRMKQSLDNCSDYEEYMASIEIIKRNNPKTSFIVLIYENTIFKIGIFKFIQFCLKNDLSDIICVGNNHPEVKKTLIAHTLKVSTYIEYHLPIDEIEVARTTNGFIYLQAKPGEKIHPKYQELKDIINFLREGEKLPNPIYCGVGISTPEDILMVKNAGSDGAFVGSVILKLHDRPEDMQAKIKELKAKTY